MSTTVDEMIEVAVKLKISKKAKSKLEKLAAQHGQDFAACASELIEEKVMRPKIDEILDPVREDFARSGMSEEEIMELGRSELAVLRKQRKAKKRD